MQTPIVQHIANELSIQSAQVEAAIDLLDDGATVPFIARYRKEVTQGLDDSQLRQLEERLANLRELQKRRETILNSIESQGQLNDELKARLFAAQTRTALEDLYLPYKPKRRTKAQLAREAGLQPLAERLLAERHLDLTVLTKAFIKPNDADHPIADEAAALAGAQYIIMERFAENAELMNDLRVGLWANGLLSATKIEQKSISDDSLSPSIGRDDQLVEHSSSSSKSSPSKSSKKKNKADKYQDYFAYQEAIKKIPSHRALALFRGQSEGILRLRLDWVDQDEQTASVTQLNHPCEQKIAETYQIDLTEQDAHQTWLLDTVRRAWRIKIHSKLETDLKMQLRESAEQEAIHVFARNLKDLLLAAPAGAKVTLGLDPGLRTGVKFAIIDPTGKVLDTGTLYPHAPRKHWDESIHQLNQLVREHQVELISIGNGTASRETDRLISDLLKRHNDLKITKLVVSEAGASVYSASALAAKEFPEMDVSLRGAVSIARRLQDPLAELVKIEPKAIGVGQYQHDVNQARLNKSLGAVIEDCVNAVGVDVNTASAALLSAIAGLNRGLAENIVNHRNQHGAFADRQALLNVKRMGTKAFEQAAGFLRILNGTHPLDASAVHPEAYPIVEGIAAKSQCSVVDLVGDSALLKRLSAQDFVTEQFGLPTINDILQELDKPGRDPRPAFITATFKEGVETLSDLNVGMKLEGVVSNVTNFGAFVDIGVHQDGLVHISALSEGFVKDPHDIVKAGDIVTVYVESVDVNRKRIALSMKKPLTESAPEGTLQQNPYQNHSLKESVGQKNKKSNKSAKQSAKRPKHPESEPFVEQTTPSPHSRSAKNNKRKNTKSQKPNGQQKRSEAVIQNSIMADAFLNAKK
ncbi:MAG TPA: RNA-binding transcriptional accessory protein [Thiothrix sp.]|nr:RNA-binding transcriptional accessory protein [Thiothrix sp.]